MGQARFFGFGGFGLDSRGGREAVGLVGWRIRRWWWMDDDDDLSTCPHDHPIWQLCWPCVACWTYSSSVFSSVCIQFFFLCPRFSHSYASLLACAFAFRHCPASLKWFLVLPVKFFPNFTTTPPIPRYPTLSTLLYAHFSQDFFFLFFKKWTFLYPFFSLCLSVCLSRCRCRPCSLPFSLSEWKPIKPNNIHIVLIIHPSHHYTPHLGPNP